MNGTTALTIRPTHTAQIDPLSAAEHFVKSGYFRDARDVSQAVVKILYGQEFGITAVTAMLNIHIIEGKPSMSAHMIGGVLRKAGYDFRVKDSTNEACAISFMRGTEVLGVSTFTKADATTAGLWGKNNWAKFPKAMLFARCMSQGARMHCPDAFMGGIYTPDELGAEVVLDAQGEVQQVIDVTPTAATQDAALKARFEEVWQALRKLEWTDQHIMAQYKVAAHSALKFHLLPHDSQTRVCAHLEGILATENRERAAEATTETAQ